MIRGFRDLRVWQQSVEFVEEVYRLSEGFPKSELYGLTNQLRRAAVSVPSNIAEGHAKEHTKEYLNHISIAQGSLAEIETQLEIAARLEYLSVERLAFSLEHLTSLRKQLYSLRNALSGKR
ncbi:MAG: four helix bundle protein [Acidobacteria bacterium]|nr:four helix bundle protein [Acidobacteriota bacterium]